jgi:hypothetical protein
VSDSIQKVAAAESNPPRQTEEDRDGVTADKKGEEGVGKSDREDMAPAELQSDFLGPEDCWALLHHSAAQETKEVVLFLLMTLYCSLPCK